VLAVGLFVVCCLLSVSLYFSIKKNFELLEIIEGYGEQITESLEDLNYYYGRIDKKSKIEIFIDEPVMRELVEDIKGTKKVIKNVAEKISVFLEEETNDEIEKRNAQEEKTN